MLDGVEFVRARVLGASFLLNQIRIMIGTAVEVARGAAPLSMFTSAFSFANMKLPMAPPTGLYLDKVRPPPSWRATPAAAHARRPPAQCVFSQYNQRFGKMHGSLDFPEADDVREQFKREHIYPLMARTVRAPLPAPVPPPPPPP